MVFDKCLLPENIKICNKFLHCYDAYLNVWEKSLLVPTLKPGMRARAFKKLISEPQKKI